MKPRINVNKSTSNAYALREIHTAIAINDNETYGLNRSPTLANFQNVPIGLTQGISSRVIICCLRVCSTRAYERP